MKPLRDLVLIELEDAVKEEKRPSGIILLSTENNRYQIGDAESVLQDLISKPKMNKGKILSIGRFCDCFSVWETVIYKKDSETSIIDVDGKRCALVKEGSVLCGVTENGYKVHDDFVLVKITKEAREALFNKKIKRHDGTEVLLFIAGDKGKEDESSSKYFVSCGEIISVGGNVEGVKSGDLGLLNYLCDNDDSIIVGYDGEDKIIAVRAITTRHKDENVFYGNGRSRDQKVWEAGEYDEMSSLYGAVSGNELIAIEPFVFLRHEETKVMKVGTGGIIFEEDEKIIKREVLAASKISKQNYQIGSGDTVIVDDFDVFMIEYNGNKISAVNDCDILYK